jgi:DnaJ-class molecular chaperone
MNPHETLGIAPGASEKEIKAAFKKLAKKYHPDMTGGDEKKFKEINNAYAILTGKEKEQPQGGDPFGFGGFNQFFNENIFDMMFRQNQNHRTVNQIRIDPEVFINGGEFLYQFQIIENRNGHLRPIQKSATIRIEPDTPVGAQIAVPGTQPNHVFVQLFAGDTQRYQIHEMVHLIETQTIDVFKAMVGGDHKVTTPQGNPISIKIPPGTQTGTIHRIRGGGLRLSDGSHGDYNIRFAISIPAIMGTEEEIKQQVLDYLTLDR